MHVRIDDLQKPAIRVAEADYDRLANLAGLGGTGGAALLGRELERARLVSDARASTEPPFVRLGSHVEFRELTTGRVRRVEITVPDAADIDRSRLSVLTPVGAALIGLTAGQAFSWTGDDGRPHVIVVHWVSDRSPVGAAEGGTV